MKTIAILGGGISGLSAAFYLLKLGKISNISKIILIENADKVGGWVTSMHQKDGTIFENAPRSIRVAGQSGLNTLLLAEELNLSKDIIPITRSHPASKNRFIYIDGQLNKLPNSFSSLIFKTPPFSKPLINTILMEPLQKKSEKKEETVKEFFDRRFGHEIADFMSNPLCRGIFAGDNSKLSMKSCFPPISKLEKDFGSVVLGMFLNKKLERPPSSLLERSKKEGWALWSLTNGLQQLSQALLDNIINSNKIQVLLDAGCSKIEFENRGVKIICKENVFNVDHVISSIPSFNLAKLLQSNSPEISRLLNNIFFASVAIVNFVFPTEILKSIPLGFGHLTSSNGKTPHVLGILYESHTFKVHNGPNNLTRITVMMGGSWFEDYFGDPSCCDKSKMIELALKSLCEHLNLKLQPLNVLINVHQHCIPQYVVGHSSNLCSIDTLISDNKLPIDLIGCSYNGVSVNDVIYNARNCIDKIVQSLI